VCHPAFLYRLEFALPQRSWLLFSYPSTLSAPANDPHPSRGCDTRFLKPTHTRGTRPSSMIDGHKFGLAQSQRFKALRLGPAVVAHPRGRATTSAPTLAPASLHPSPAPLCLRLPSSLPLLLRVAALTGPTVPAAAAPLPSRLLHLHRSMPPLRPSIGLRLASFSRFIYATLAVFSISCVVYGFRRFPLPQSSLSHGTCWPHAPRMRQGQGSADGAPAEVPSAPPKMQAVRESMFGGWCLACSR
jgi:hypothetical protein